jgi:hypothetical protein
MSLKYAAVSTASGALASHQTVREALLGLEHVQLGLQHPGAPLAEIHQFVQERIRDMPQLAPPAVTHYTTSLHSSQPPLPTKAYIKFVDAAADGEAVARRVTESAVEELRRREALILAKIRALETQKDKILHRVQLR